MSKYKIKAFKEESDLIGFAMNESTRCLCGVQFTNQDLKSFTYKIRFSYSSKSLIKYIRFIVVNISKDNRFNQS